MGKSKSNSEFGIQNSESEPENAANQVKSKTGKRDTAPKGKDNAVESVNAECETRNAESDDDVKATPESEIIAENPDGDNSEVQIPNSELENALAAERDRYLRLAAEYDNFRKRSIKEREMTYSDARTDAITRILPVYDNLERALKMECADEAFYKGIEMTLTGLTEILESMDVKRIQAVGKPFDPNRHNAIMTIENPELGEKVVAEEFQKGFLLGERVIRFSTVVVAN